MFTMLMVLSVGTFAADEVVVHVSGAHDDASVVLVSSGDACSAAFDVEGARLIACLSQHSAGEADRAAVVLIGTRRRGELERCGISVAYAAERAPMGSHRTCSIGGRTLDLDLTYHARAASPDDD